jgi:hypothetical protein
MNQNGEKYQPKPKKMKSKEAIQQQAEAHACYETGYKTLEQALIELDHRRFLALKSGFIAGAEWMQAQPAPQITIDGDQYHKLSWLERLTYRLSQRNPEHFTDFDLKRLGEIREILSSVSPHPKGEFFEIVRSDSRLAPVGEAPQAFEWTLEKVKSMNPMEVLNFLQFYTRIIGQVEEGQHPDESLPRAESFLKERANWQSEVEALREKIKEQELIIHGLEEGAEEWQMKCSDLEHQLSKMRGKYGPGTSNTDVASLATLGSSSGNSMDQFRQLAYQVEQDTIDYMVKEVLHPEPIRGRFGNWMSFSEALRSFAGYLLQNIECVAKGSGNSVEQGENGDPWISVKDRLPYKDGDSQIFCLVWDTYEGQAVVRPYNEYHKCWDDEDADDFYTDATEGNITHWQPLPPKPQQP